MDNAFRYIEKNKGIDTEMSYPYEAKVRFHTGLNQYFHITDSME